MTANIGISIGIIIIALSGLIGAILDLKYEIVSPVLYWILGTACGAVAMTVIFFLG